MPERDDPLRTIAERHFTSHGPATWRDFVVWAGFTVADAKLARAVSANLRGGPGYLYGAIGSLR